MQKRGVGIKIVICIDTNFEAVGGVLTAVKNLIRALEKIGHSVKLIHPGLFRSFTHPFYPLYRIAIPFLSSIEREMQEPFDAVHLFSESGIALQMSRYCKKRGIFFTSTYNTNLDQYAGYYSLMPRKLVVWYFRWLLNRAKSVMVATDTLAKKLRSWGVKHTVKCPLGVDTTQFYPRKREKSQDRILLYVGRVAKEKNLEVFLSSKVPGKKIIVGDGPIRQKLEAQYREVEFTGFLQGDRLAEVYSTADVLVFPSKTDTFGLVMLEALACGTPVAAYPVEGPIDIIVDSRLGCLSDNLDEAIETALALGERGYCVKYAEGYSWDKAASEFASQLHPIESPFLRN